MKAKSVDSAESLSLSERLVTVFSFSCLHNR